MPSLPGFWEKLWWVGFDASCCASESAIEEIAVGGIVIAEPRVPFSGRQHVTALDEPRGLRGADRFPHFDLGHVTWIEAVLLCHFQRALCLLRFLFRNELCTRARYALCGGAGGGLAY